MTTVILTTVAKAVLPLVLMFSVYLLGRGHNSPGGGFIAGVMVGIVIALQYAAFGSRYARGIFRVNPLFVLAVGLLVAAGTGMASIALGLPFLTSTFLIVHLPFLGEIELASAFFFDVGVFLVVAGTVSAIVSTIGGR
ncbi:MnhB domain-containing protein [Chloroflexota bacterium]